VETRGFPNSRFNTRLVRNGTFFNSYDYFPHLGYVSNFQLIDPSKRKKHGLPPVERLPKIDDESARSNNALSAEADWLDFETIVSTSPDQIAIAPGYLQREWTENGRRYFHYKMDSPILSFWSYLSAEYAVKRDRWKDVAIEIYYDPAHPYNVDRMIEASKKSLDYFTANLGPYQHKQVRIIEFPRYARFAQSFPNTIPFSESIGFIARIKKPEDIDYVTYVTAHEIAHQWWGHQVVGANQQGSTMLIESMSQYSALMVMEKLYGAQQMRRFLKYELDRYLSGRGTELVEELPLLLVEDQSYIHYSKGSLCFYALRDLIGEDSLNRALALYVKDKKFQQPPYTNSRELLSYIQEAVPEEKSGIINDLFETITIYDLKTTNVRSKRQSDGKYEVQMEIEARKYRSDGKGKETETPMNDWIDLGVLGKKKENGEDNILALRKERVASGKQQVQFLVEQEPETAGIDPLNKMIDRNPDDNTRSPE
jgi:aminopeptidase N